MGPTLTLEKREIPCFLCGKALDIRRDKRNKSYFICDPCGVQAFVRRRAGIERLYKIVSGIRKRCRFFEETQTEILQIQTLINEIDQVREEISKAETKIGFLFPDPALVHARNALKTRLKNALTRLDILAKSKTTREENEANSK